MDFDLETRLRGKFKHADNLLVLAVGGGNDSVSSLLLLRQLERDFEFGPERVTIAAMLPDGVEYSDLRETTHPLVHEIIPISSRWINKKKIEAFPEPLLAEAASQFHVERVVGIDMIKGSIGVAQALHKLIRSNGFDTVLAVDVGGDFIATPENQDVMSPMMDSYAGYALKAAVSSNPNVNFIFGVIGLGTDGESTPEMLDTALTRLDEVYQGTLQNVPKLNEVIQFYHEVIEPNRPSRTMALTAKSIQGFPIHRFTHQFRNRFHTQPRHDEVKTYYAYFDHVLDEEHTGKYYLFDRVWDLKNPFILPCESSVEWFKSVQSIGDKLCHELNGQTVVDGDSRTYFGTPPRRFVESERNTIIQEIIDSIYNGVYTRAYVYSDDIVNMNLSGLTLTTNGKLTLITV